MREENGYAAVLWEQRVQDLNRRQMIFLLMHLCTDIFICKGYKNGKLKSVFSKATIIVVKDFRKCVVCHTWERLWCRGIAHWRRSCGFI